MLYPITDCCMPCRTVIMRRVLIMSELCEIYASKVDAVLFGMLTTQLCSYIVGKELLSISIRLKSYSCLKINLSDG